MLNIGTVPLMRHRLIEHGVIAYEVLLGHLLFSLLWRRPISVTILGNRRSGMR